MEELDEEQLLAADQNKYTRITELNLLLSDRLKRIEELKDKAKQINQDLKKEENEKLTVTKTLQDECELKDKGIKDLEANIEKLELHMTDNKEQREIRYKEQIEKLREEKERELEDTIR